MKSYKCLIVDDNEIERDAILMNLNKVARLEIIAVCNNGFDAAQVLANEQIDIVFSDVDMPALSGFSLLKSSLKTPVFIFITSFSEYASEGFNLDALDFIVKPASFERLLKASNKAIEYLDLKKIVAENKDSPTLQTATANHFFVKETKGFTRLNYDDVIYIESMGDFSKIYTANNMHVTLVNLKNLEIQLPVEFIRVHKQYMINVNHIATVANSEIFLSHNHTVPLSLLHKQSLMDKISSKTIYRNKK